MTAGSNVASRRIAAAAIVSALVAGAVGVGFPPPASGTSPSTISTLAGTGTAGAAGDGGPASQAQLNAPAAVAIDGAGNVFVADARNNRIREVVASSGTISTVAGTGTAGFAGDGGSATAALLNGPSGIAVTPNGDLYIADSVNQRIRQVTKSNGIITTIAGTGVAGYNGDNISPLTARLATPKALVLDSAGGLYLADQDNARVRLIKGGNISTVAGNGTIGYSGDGGAATFAALWNPEGVALDSAGNLYIGDSSNARVRMVSAGSGTITTIAGTGAAGYGGDGGPARSAQLNAPAGLAVDAADDLYIADSLNARVRVIRNGTISTAAGTTSAGFSGDGGYAGSAQLKFPYAVAVDANNVLTIADHDNQRVRQVSAPVFGSSPQFSQPVGLNPVRTAGSENLLYVMGRLAGLYSQSSLAGCPVNPADNRTCTSIVGPPPDNLDDYSRNEVDNAGSASTDVGLAQLCGASATGGLAVDLARTTRPLIAGDYQGACTAQNLLAYNFADDSIAPVTFPGINTSLIAGAATCSGVSTAATPPAATPPGCQLGPVSAGWRPGDALAGPYTGAAFTNLTTGAGGLASRLYCPAATAPITDWGQLTDKTQPVGSGAKIGAPIVIPALSTTASTYTNLAAVLGCDPNTNNTDKRVAQENAAPLLADLAVADNPGTTTAALVAQGNQMASTLYYLSYGFSQWRPFTATITQGARTTAANLLSVDNVTPSTACAIPNSGACFTNANVAVAQITTARRLFLVVRTDRLRASTAGFLNWLCDTDPGTVHHGRDHTTGQNYSAEVDYTINTQHLFPRVPCLGTASAPVVPFVGKGTPPPSGGAAITDMFS